MTIPEAQEKMKDEFRTQVLHDPQLNSIRVKIQNGGTYSDAEAYGIRSGEILSNVYKSVLNAELFGEPLEHSALGKAIIPLMYENYKYVSSATSAVQEHLNSISYIGMKPISSEFDISSAYNIVGKMAQYVTFDDAAWMLDMPVVTNSLEIVDRTLHENIEFQLKSGLQPKIIRTAEPDCCDNCAALEGEYDYEEVRDRNNPVFWRHNNCQCEITYFPGDGKAQDVRSKNWIDESQRDERVNKYLSHEKIHNDEYKQKMDTFYRYVTNEKERTNWNSPPTPREMLERMREGENDPNNQGIIARRILNGELSLDYKNQKYEQHTKGSPQYISSTQGRQTKQSYLTIDKKDAIRLVYEYAGTGCFRPNTNGLINVEYVNVPYVIGEYYDKKINDWRPTTRVQIMYGNDGVHIIPVKELA